MKSRLTFLIVLGSGFAFNQTTLITDSAFEQHLINIGADSGIPDGSVPTAQIEGILQLNIQNMMITDLTGIEDFAALEILECDWNSLTTLDVSQNTNLLFLFCAHNQLTSINISNCQYLISLQCDNNYLTSLDLSGSPGLQFLNCGINYLSTLDISANNALVLLGCYENNLTNLDVTDQPYLETLQCEDNQIAALDLSNNPVLEFLNTGSNLLTGLDISSNPIVDEFYCSNNSELECLNVRNGNNVNFLHFEALNSPLLNCIEVDDSVWANNNWLTNIDAGTEFSNLCGNSCSSNQLGFLENPGEVVLNVYPNPTRDIVQLEWNEALVEDYTIEFLDIHGRLVYMSLIPAGTQKMEFHLQHLGPGVYFVRSTQAGIVTIQQLVLE